ncbi:MAG: folate-binding protein YgfZ [Rhodocyclaceae bacterium]|nr:folate-binding protein YgfZ [Rhodocyclaceae bacterium]
MTQATKQDWLDFLATRQLSGDGEHFGSPGAELVAARDATVVVPLIDQDLIRASGEDARGFLHNLLTNDVENLPADGVRFAGFCTAKGRLLATFHLWHDGSDLLLALAADIQPAILKKLSMYVLRSKVKLADPGLVLIGVAGADARAVIDALADRARAVPLGGNRHLLSMSPAAAMEAWPDLAARATPAGAAAWRWLEIAAGQPRVVAATQEAFVPQMVNMELPAVGGVSFTKGCYPGQEIVARTQYLGKIKRRMYRARIDQALPAGTEVFTAESGDQHCGALVTVAPSPEGGHECLVVVQSSGAESGEVFAGKPGGPPRLTLLTLPYDVI